MKIKAILILKSALVATLACLSLTACVTEIGPASDSVYVRGHYNRSGIWIPGHYMRVGHGRYHGPYYHSPYRWRHGHHYHH